MTYVIIFRLVFSVLMFPKRKTLLLRMADAKIFERFFRINVLQDITDIFELL